MAKDEPLPGGRVIGLLFMVAVLAAVETSAAEEPPESPGGEVAALKEEIHAINLINLLDLSVSQIDVILEQSRRARPWIDARREELKAIYPRQVEVFREFKAEDERNCGLSDRIMRAAGRAEHAEKEVDERVFARLNRFSLKVYEALTREQILTVERYQPFLFPQEHRDREMRKKSDSRIKLVKDTLIETSGMSDKRYRQRKEKLVERILDQLPRPQPVPAKKDRKKSAGKRAAAKAAPVEDEAAVRERIGAVLDEVRLMSEREVEERYMVIIENDLVPSKKDQLVREMYEIARSKHATPNNVSRYLLNPDVVPYLEKIRPKAGNAVTTGVR
jgi:hypothetical protein